MYLSRADPRKDDLSKRVLFALDYPKRALSGTGPMWGSIDAGGVGDTQGSFLEHGSAVKIIHLERSGQVPG